MALVAEAAAAAITAGRWNRRGRTRSDGPSKMAIRSFPALLRWAPPAATDRCIIPRARSSDRRPAVKDAARIIVGVV